MIRLEELQRDGGKWLLRGLYLNPAWIIRIQEDYNVTSSLRCNELRDKFPEGLDARHVISKVTYACGSSTSSALVVGSPEIITKKLTGQKQILRD